MPLLKPAAGLSRLTGQAGVLGQGEASKGAMLL